MTVSGLSPGEARGGVAYGPDDTFYIKDAGGTLLHYGTFNLASSSALITRTLTLPTGLSGFGPLDTLLDSGLLAALQVNTSSDGLAHNLVLFYPESPTVLDVEPFGASGNANPFATGAVDFGGGKVFALAANNGIRAYDIIPEPSTRTLLTAGIVLQCCRRARLKSFRKLRSGRMGAPRSGSAA